MADEPTKTVQDTEPTKSGKVVFNSQEDFDAVIEQRVARERKKYSDYDVVRQRAETLEAELNKRKTAELSEMEKLKVKVDEQALENENLKGKASKYDEIVAQVTKDVEAESEGLSEEQLKVVGYILDPHAKLSAIRQFKNVGAKAPKIAKGGKEGDPSLDEINELKDKGDPKWQELWKVYRQKKNIYKNPSSIF